VFICSAPLVDLGQPNAGLSLPGVRLACAEPGDQLAIFSEALHELAERSAFLYEEAGRFWFSTHPTLNREADNRAKALPDHEVDAAIVEILREDAKIKGGFHRVHAAPDDPIAIDETASLSLVIFGPATPHSGKGAIRSAATDAATETLTRCRTSQLMFRNTLIFVAPDEASLENARQVMRKALAWRSIVDDERLVQQLTQAQVTDAGEKKKSHDSAAVKAVRAAWSHILHPVKSEIAGKPVDFEHDLITSRERPALPSVIYEKVKADGIALEKLGTERLWLALNPIWPGDRPHLTVAEISDWFASYVYLPRVRDVVVLQAAIRGSIAELDPKFGYADGFDEALGRYRNLIVAEMPPEIMPPTALLVRAVEAMDQRSREREETKPAEDSPEHERKIEAHAEPQRALKKPRRFFGSIEIDMVRPVKSFDAILNAVVMELQRTQGTKVKLTLEIEAEAPDGFADGEVGVVRDNSRQLKFKPESTGFGD
jgi:hypothetical protein